MKTILVLIFTAVTFPALAHHTKDHVESVAPVVHNCVAHCATNKSEKDQLCKSMCDAVPVADKKPKKHHKYTATKIPEKK